MEMEDEQLQENNIKYEYLNSPSLLEDFKSNYLNSLNIFLNDEKFKEKTDSLPVLKSSAITKYEKLISKEQAEMLKLKNKMSNRLKPLNIENRKDEKNRMYKTTPNIKRGSPFGKGLQIRYIIMDHELVEISLQAIEESSEMNNKLIDPFNAYFHEQNPKIRKKALEEIINNIMPKRYNKENSKDDIYGNRKYKNRKSNNINTEVNEIDNYSKFKTIYQDIEILQKKYKNYDIDQKRKDEKYAPILKHFNENCNNHNIITLDQKIDYFVYLYKNNLLKPIKSKNYLPQKNSLKKYNKKNISVPKLVTPSNKNSTSNINSIHKSSIPNNYSNIYDNNAKYIYELKNNFKIIDDLNISQLKTFERDLDNKIKSFQIMKENFEKSEKFIDKLRMVLRCKEVSQEKVILRNCEITGDRLYYLISKKYFDFGNIRHLNLANNNLGDIGGAYLLFLISRFSTRIDYLNINNNKIGRISCEILIDILQSNIVKLYGLSINGNKIGDKLFSDISLAISKNSYLNKLFIGDNDLGKISSVILGSILKYDKKLKLLDVSKNNLGDENIGFMLKGLICNTSLETLMMNNMGMTNKSLRIFETTLCINSTLKTLFLERNKITFKGCRLLSDILNKNKHIEYISLVGNNFETEHINYIIEQQRQIKLRSISKTDYFLQITSGDEDINFYEYLD